MRNFHQVKMVDLYILHAWQTASENPVIYAFFSAISRWSGVSDIVISYGVDSLDGTCFAFMTDISIYSRQRRNKHQQQLLKVCPHRLFLLSVLKDKHSTLHSSSLVNLAYLRNRLFFFALRQEEIRSRQHRMRNKTAQSITKIINR